MKKAHSRTWLSNIHSETQKLRRQNANVLRSRSVHCLLSHVIVEFPNSRHMYALRTFFFSSATLFAPNHVTRNEWSWHMPWCCFGHVCPWFGLYGDKMVPNWEHNLYQTILINDIKGHICMAKWSQDLSKLKWGRLSNENGTLTGKSYKLLMTTILMMWCWWLILAVISKSFAT